jgi:hypothetical protein
MEKDQVMKSVARIGVAALGMALVSAADEAANHKHNAQQKKRRIAGHAVLGAVCQAVMEYYYNSTKKEQ